MKKGCFLKGVIILTIFIAIVAYLIQNELENLLPDFRKDFFFGLWLDEQKSEYDFVKTIFEKDSLFKIIEAEVESASTLDELDKVDFDSIADKLKLYFQDSLITSAELDKFKSFISEHFSKVKKK